MTRDCKMDSKVTIKHCFNCKYANIGFGYCNHPKNDDKREQGSIDSFCSCEYFTGYWEEEAI